MAGWRTPVPRSLVAHFRGALPISASGRTKNSEVLAAKIHSYASNYLVASEKQDRFLGDDGVPSSGKPPLNLASK
jgi:hypothetical protein